MIWYDELREDVSVRTSARTAFCIPCVARPFLLLPWPWLWMSGLSIGTIMAKVKVMVDIGEWSGFGGP